jgi:N-acetylglucosamine-6-phosphate deacetylase
MPLNLFHLLFHNAHLITPTADPNPGWLLTEGKTIHSLGSGQPPDFDRDSITRIIDCHGMALLPGFIDLHVHGAAGHEVMDASPEKLADMARFYARHGVTGFLATTWTAGHFETLNALRAVSVQMGQQAGNEARILGVHLEGPYLNPARCGAQDVRHIRHADQPEACALLDSSLVRRLTLAPEFPENLWLVDECVRRGVAVSAGHSDATFEQMQVAVEHGLSQVTHTFNAMRALDHREPGILGAVLADQRLTADIIADGIHVHPDVVRLFLRAKGAERAVLITDAISATGMGDGRYRLGGFEVEVRGERCERDGRLAGSVLTLDRAVRNAMKFTGCELQQAVRMATLNPARVAGFVAGQKYQKKARFEVVVHDANGAVCPDRVSAVLRQATGILIGGGHTPTYQRLYATEPIRGVIRQRYGQVFFDSLPDYAYTSDIAEVEKFFDLPASGEWLHV